MANLLFESYDPVTLRHTEVERENDGGLVFVHSQDTRPIVESAKTLASNFDPHARHGDIVHVARIPLVVWNNLRKLGITSDPVALNAWLDERDHRVFRVDDGRKL